MPTVREANHKHGPIVKYNGVFARRQLALAKRPKLGRRPFLEYAGNLCPPMPPSINKLMQFGLPIGTRAMYNQVTHQPYFKFNGLKQSQALAIAQYMISIPASERKEIFEQMLMKTRPDMFAKILKQYQRVVHDLWRKNDYIVKAKETLVLDESGVLH